MDFLPSDLYLLLKLEQELFPKVFSDSLRQGFVQCSELFCKHRLPFLEDRIKGLILGNALECDVRHGLAVEGARTLNIAFRIGQPGTIGVSLNILSACGPEFVVIELRRQQPLPGNGNRHPADINRDPPSSPLLSYIRRCPASARGIKHKIARVGGHQHASFDNFLVRLNNICLFTSVKPPFVSVHRFPTGVTEKSIKEHEI